MVEDAMLDELRNAVDSIPVAIIAFAGPPAIWAKAAWASPFLKTYRHGISGSLALLAGLLMVASLRNDRPVIPILLIGAAIAMAAMFAALLWPPTNRPPKRKVR
jgi:hypothetical protein